MISCLLDTLADPTRTCVGASEMEKDDRLLGNGIHVFHATHIRIVLDAARGNAASQRITQWDIGEYLREEFGDQIIDVTIAIEYGQLSVFT